MTRNHLRRLAAGATAALTAVAITAPPATAAPLPDIFSASGAGEVLRLQVGLPAALAGQLGAVLDQLEPLGITLEDNALTVNLSAAVTDLLRSEAGADTIVGALADPVTGSLAGLIEAVTGGGLACLSNETIEIQLPEATVPLLSADLLSAECTEDADGNLSVASATVADLTVDLLGLVEALPISQEVQDAVETVETTLDDAIDQVTDALSPVLGPVLDTVEDTTGITLDLDEILDVPNLLDTEFPLLEVGLIKSTSTSNVVDGVARNVTETTLAGLQILNGTLCLPDVTYVTDALANGQPGGADATASIPHVDLNTCGSQSILSLIEVGGLLEDVSILGQPVSEILNTAGLEQVTEGLTSALAMLGLSEVVQGSVAERSVAADGTSALIRVAPIALKLAPFSGDAILAATPLGDVLSDVFVALEINPTVSQAGARVLPVAPPPPAVPPTNPPSLPRTGGGAALALLGLAAVGGAIALRKQLADETE